jgi:hypothetical protein
MKVPGMLAVAVVLLLLVQVLSPFGGTDLYLLPVGSALGCFAIAVTWGLIRGPAAVRWAMLLWLASYVLLALSVWSLWSTPVTTGFGSPDQSVTYELLAASVAVFTLAGVQGIRASLTRGPGVRGPSAQK